MENLWFTKQNQHFLQKHYVLFSKTYMFNGKPMFYYAKPKFSKKNCVLLNKTFILNGKL